jgi:hypothetical protein
MKKYFIFVTVLVFITGFAYSQSLSLDASLDSLNIAASANIAGFKADMALSYDISEGEIESLMINADLEPADLFMTLELADLAGKTPDETAAIVQENKDKGWGVVAKQLGIKPGSKEFKNIKNKASQKAEKKKNNKKTD